MSFLNIYDKVCYVMNLLDSKITELKPEYGYVEKFTICREIVKMNDYLLPCDEVIIETLHMIISNGQKE